MALKLSKAEWEHAEGIAALRQRSDYADKLTAAVREYIRECANPVADYMQRRRLREDLAKLVGEALP